MTNAKRLVAPIVTAGVGFLTFIFMIMDYFYVDFESLVSYGESAYKSIGRFFDLGGFFDGRFFGVLTGIGLICLIIAAVAMLAVGVLCLLKMCANIDILGDAVPLTFVTKLTVLIYFIISVSTSAMYFLFCAINSFDVSLGVGWWFLLIIGVGEFVTFKIFADDFLTAFAGGPSIAYKCSSCGAKAKSSDKFCKQCGGSVVAVRTEPAPEYRCSSCNSRAKENEKFCAKCGSPIIAIRPTVVDLRCSRCGAPAKNGEKFCAQCGSPVVAVRNDAANQFTCSNCGAPAKAGERFCANCGSPVVAAQNDAPKPFICPNCGTPANPNDRFCAGCGATVNSAQN